MHHYRQAGQTLDRPRTGRSTRTNALGLFDRQRSGNSGLKEQGWIVLFNDALNTFYLRLYGVRHMVKDRSDSERRNLLPPLPGWLVLISSKGSFICIIPHRRARTKVFVIPTGSLVGTRNTSLSRPWGTEPITHHTMSRCSTIELHLAPCTRETQTTELYFVLNHSILITNMLWEYISVDIVVYK